MVQKAREKEPQQSGSFYHNLKERKGRKRYEPSTGMGKSMFNLLLYVMVAFMILDPLLFFYLFKGMEMLPKLLIIISVELIWGMVILSFLWLEGWVSFTYAYPLMMVTGIGALLIAGIATILVKRS